MLKHMKQQTGCTVEWVSNEFSIFKGKKFTLTWVFLSTFLSSALPTAYPGSLLDEIKWFSLL